MTTTEIINMVAEGASRFPLASGICLKPLTKPDFGSGESEAIDNLIATLRFIETDKLSPLKCQEHNQPFH